MAIVFFRYEIPDIRRCFLHDEIMNKTRGLLAENGYFSLLETLPNAFPREGWLEVIVMLSENSELLLQ